MSGEISVRPHKRAGVAKDVRLVGERSFDSDQKLLAVDAVRHHIFNEDSESCLCVMRALDEFHRVAHVNRDIKQGW